MYGKDIHQPSAGVCLWTLSKTKLETALGRHRRMKRETQKTNQTVVAELKLEAPFSAKQKGVLHSRCLGEILVSTSDASFRRCF